MSDNTTTISYVKNRLGIQSTLFNEIAKEIWLRCTSRGLWVSAAHITDTENCEGDSFSKNIQEGIEWSLNGDQFQKTTSKLVTPT